MYFDGTARRNGAGAGVLFVSSRKDLLPYLFVLTQNCSNNESEYQDILLGLGMAVEMKLPQQNIYGNSALGIKQLTGEFEVKKLELVPSTLHYVPRSENGLADALAGIAASLAQFDERPNQAPICERWVVPPPTEEETEEEQTDEMEESFPISASENEVGDWREPISNFLRYGTLPADLRERVHIRRAAPRDATEMARTCKSCQLHVNYIHRPPEPLHPTVASWSFEAWGMDIINPITPKSDCDRQYILATTDYFSKWAEVATYREVKATTVADFIRTQIIYRYGVPRYVVMDNSTPFRNLPHTTADIVSLQPGS
ncbi:hypothetical protein H6P81_006328 [Aristolochia fimbriata]|uniref:Integrase catalytic domain-containing protein n=1 Tax=Aristolochia fimbriata TaxID=158543 RepID=A0AAV7EY66_ARIFI|nr:hypothetical protein H6P81_006328 [Aristolochia fimbriata]